MPVLRVMRRFDFKIDIRRPSMVKSWNARQKITDSGETKCIFLPYCSIKIIYACVIDKGYLYLGISYPPPTYI